MLRLNLGDLLTWQEEEYVVAAARPQTALLRRLGDNETVWIDVPILADEIVVTDRVAPPDVGEPTRALEPISDDELEAARWWVPHLNEITHGVPDPDDPAAVPRPGYGPGTTKWDRTTLKVEELTAAGHKTSARSLQRKQQRYNRHGLHGLVDRRTIVGGSGVPRADDRVLEAVLAVLAATRGDSTVSVATLIDKTRAHLARRHRDEDITLPSDRTMRRVFAAYDRRGLATGKATTRRTEANRHERGPRPIAATTPGQYVEIDSTPINVMALLSDGKPGRVHLTVAMDVATRSMLAFDIVPTGASGVEHADLLGRMLRPRQCRADAPDYLRLDKAGDLPAAALLAADARQDGAVAVPYIVPETITTDRGKDYLSETFVSACRHFGISVIAAPPHSPTYKGHVERLMGTIETSWMQKLPGYVGNSVANRGREIDLSGLLTVHELRESFEEWWVRVYQRTPHRELRDRDLPSRCYSPNQMYTALFDAGAGIPVPIDEATFISLMRPYARTIQSDGIHIENLTYWHDDLVALRKLTPPTKDGKWVVRRDPYDPDRVWVQHPPPASGWSASRSPTDATATRLPPDYDSCATCLKRTAFPPRNGPPNNWPEHPRRTTDKAERSGARKHTPCAPDAKPRQSHDRHPSRPRRRPRLSLRRPIRTARTSPSSAPETGSGMTDPTAPAVKNTLVGMRRQIDRVVPEPATLIRAEYEALSEVDRYTYDEERTRWFGSGFTLRNKATTELLRSVRGYVAMRDMEAVGSQGVCVLTGPANVGKSTTLLQLAKEVETRTGRRHPGFRDDGRVPVVFIEMLPGATPKGVATSILDFFAVPHRQREPHQILIRQAAEIMVRHRTALLIVDEFHAVQLDGRRGDDAINTVKAIINNTGVVTVLAGIDLDLQLGSRAAEQLMARGETHRHAPFDYASEGSRSSWARLVDAFALQMRLIDGPPDLSPYADALHSLTSGRIGALRRILGFAMLTLLEEKTDPTQPEALLEAHMGTAARQLIGDPNRKNPNAA